MVELGWACLSARLPPSLLSRCSRTTPSPSGPVLESLQCSRCPLQSSRAHSGSGDGYREHGPGHMGKQKKLFAQVRRREMSRCLDLGTCMTLGVSDQMAPPGQSHSVPLWSRDSEVPISGSVNTHPHLHTLDSIKPRKPCSVTCPWPGLAPLRAAKVLFPTTPPSPSPNPPDSPDTPEAIVSTWPRPLSASCLLALPACPVCVCPDICLSEGLQKEKAGTHPAGAM